MKNLICLLCVLVLVGSVRAQSPIQAPPPPMQPPLGIPGKSVLLLKPAWFGENRFRGRVVQVVPLEGASVLVDTTPPWKKVLDPLGIFR